MHRIEERAYLLVAASGPTLRSKQPFGLVDVTESHERRRALRRPDGVVTHGRPPISCWGRAARVSVTLCRSTPATVPPPPIVGRRFVGALFPWTTHAEMLNFCLLVAGLRKFPLAKLATLRVCDFLRSATKHESRRIGGW